MVGMEFGMMELGVGGEGMIMRLCGGEGGSWNGGFRVCCGLR